MAAITTRETVGGGATVKGLPLTNAELDTNFININVQLGNAVLTTATYANPSWITSLSETKVLPSQTGQNGKFLTTNGSTTSWAAVTLPSGQTAGSTTSGYLQYSGTTTAAGQINGSTTAPTATTRLNYEGHFYATKYFGDGSSLTGIISGATITNDVSTNADTFYPGLTSNQVTGAWTSAVVSNTKLYFNPSTGTLNSTSLNALSDVKVQGNTVVDSSRRLQNVKEYVQVVSTNTTAVASYTYVVTASITLTLPISPSVGDFVKISNRSGTASVVIARNGQNIMSVAEDLTIDVVDASFTLVYTDSTRGWTIL